jgi:uncharacterized protein (TIGR03437 family)
VVVTFWKFVMLIAVLPAALLAQTTNAGPSYSAASIVNAATQTAGALAPNTIATLYGTNLAFDTAAVTAANLNAGTLPTSLDGVSVLVYNMAAPLLFVSPGQINFIVPYGLLAGMVTVVVTRQNVAGPVVTIQLDATSPGLFLWNGNMAIATHLDGSLASSTAPARAGEIIVLYAAGLGSVSPATTSGRLAPSAASMVAKSQMQVLLNSTPCSAASVLYAGLAPGFAGLYQINLTLPTPVPVNPQIQIAVAGAQTSPAAIQLATQ